MFNDSLFLSDWQVLNVGADDTWDFLIENFLFDFMEVQYVIQFIRKHTFI